MAVCHPPSGQCIDVVELVCAEHLQRTLLNCDEATAFQRIVCQCVAVREGKWSFEQYKPAPYYSARSYCCKEEYLLVLMKRFGDGKMISDLQERLKRREDFMRNEGSLLQRMALASRGIRDSGTAMYPWNVMSQ